MLIRGSIRSGAVRQLIAEPRVGMRILSEDELTASLNGKARPDLRNTTVLCGATVNRRRRFQRVWQDEAEPADQRRTCLAITPTGA